MNAINESDIEVVTTESLNEGQQEATEFATALGLLAIFIMLFAMFGMEGYLW